MNYYIKEGAGSILIGLSVPCIHYGNSWILVLGGTLLITGITMLTYIDIDKKADELRKELRDEFKQ